MDVSDEVPTAVPAGAQELLLLDTLAKLSGVPSETLQSEIPGIQNEMTLDELRAAVIQYLESLMPPET